MQEVSLYITFTRQGIFSLQIFASFIYKFLFDATYFRLANTVQCKQDVADTKRKLN